MFIIQINHYPYNIWYIQYILHVYMHLLYNNTSYALDAYDPLSFIVIDSLPLLSFPLFNDVQTHPPCCNPTGLILNSLSFIKFSFYIFILNPIFWI